MVHCYVTHRFRFFRHTLSRSSVICSRFRSFSSLQERCWSGAPIIGGFFTWCLKKGHKGGAKLQAKAGRGLYVALLLFVGIPLPGTGAWTGTLAASFLDMDFKKSTISVMGGVLLAGVIIGVLSAVEINVLK